MAHSKILRKIINKLLSEGYKDIENYFKTPRNDGSEEFFYCFKKYIEDHYKTTNFSQFLANITTPIFKWLFLCVPENILNEIKIDKENISSDSQRKLDELFDISIKYLYNKNNEKLKLINFNNSLTWLDFKSQVMEGISSKLEIENIVRLISKPINTKWFESSNQEIKSKQDEIKRMLPNWNYISSKIPKDRILIIEPRTTFSSKFWGNPRCFGVDIGYGTKWCTSATESGNAFHNYVKSQNKYLVYVIDLKRKDEDPFQKIAVLINRNLNEFEIFDARDQNHKRNIPTSLRQDVKDIINEIINFYTKSKHEQYSPSDFKTFSKEDRHTLFLTTLRDFSSDDKKYIKDHFTDFFYDPATTDHDKKEILFNLIGTSKYFNDNNLIGLIQNYLNTDKTKDYEKIINYLNTEDKNKAAEKFYSHRLFFSNDIKEDKTEHWEILSNYLYETQKEKIAIKFILKHQIFFKANWHELSVYLTDSQKSIAAEKFLIRDSHIASANSGEDAKKYLLPYLTTDKRNIVDKKINLLNKDYYFDKELWSKIFDSLSEEEIHDVAKDFLLNKKIYFNNKEINSEDIELTDRMDLVNNLTNEEKKQAAENYIINNDDFNGKAWKALSRYLNESQKEQAAFTFIYNSDKINAYDYMNLNIYLNATQKKDLAARHVLNNKKYDAYAWEIFKNYIPFDQLKTKAIQLLLADPSLKKELFSFNIAKHKQPKQLLFTAEEKKDLTKQMSSKKKKIKEIKLLELFMNNIF
jgi:hypothetical protein